MQHHNLDAFGLSIIPHGRSPGALGEIPFLRSDGRAARYGDTVEIPIPGSPESLALGLGPQPNPSTLGQRIERVITHPATGWAVAAALLGALLVRRSRGRVAWVPPSGSWGEAPWMIHPLA